jgi:hypothetical protein
VNRTLIIGAVAAAGVFGAYLLWQKNQEQAVQAAAAAPPMVAPAVVMPKPAAPAQLAAAPSAPTLPKLPQALSTFGTAVAGVQVQAAIGSAVEKVGGVEAGKVATVAQAAVGLGILVGKGTEKLADALGAPKEVGATAGILTGTAVVFGAPAAVGVASLKVAGVAAQAVLKAVAGEKVEAAVSGAVSQLDPFLKGSVANTVVTPIAVGVKAIANVFNPGPSPVEQAKAVVAQYTPAQVVQATVQAQKVGGSVVLGKTGLGAALAKLGK